MPNVKTAIATHNRKTLSNIKDTNAHHPTNECNCRKTPDCPLSGKCLQTNIVYQATVTTNTSNQTYIGLATNFCLNMYGT